jgi:CRP-like cAMP-binding protein
MESPPITTATPTSSSSSSLAERHPPLWEESTAFALSRLKGAGVRVAERRFEAGEIIYARGEPNRFVYFLTEGVLKFYRHYQGHKEFVMTLLEEGNVFGEPALHPRDAHRDTAQAAGPCQVAAVSRMALECHALRDARCALALLTAYAQWTQHRERATVRLIPWEIRHRLAVVLVELADRFGEPIDGEVLIRVRLTHHMLADMTASSRVSVSKEMSRFRRETLIESRGAGRVVLLNKPWLVEIARSW